MGAGGRIAPRGWIAILLVLCAAAFCFRFPQLEERPLHCDEAVHAIKFKGLWEGRGYRYNPDEYHGPSLYYLTLPVARLASWIAPQAPDERVVRLVPALCGATLILLLLGLGDGLGCAAALFAGVLTAVSPAMVYYSRYYIHELWLVWFTTLALIAGWRYWQRPHPGWAALAGAGLGLMQATKETFVFNLAAAAGAGLVVWWLQRRQKRSPDPVGDPRPTSPQPRMRLTHLWLALAVALATSVVLFSSFFTNAHGPLDSLLTYVPWLNRAGGASPHIHPWNFYFERLLAFHPPKGPFWTEGLILLLALVGLVCAFLGRPVTPAHNGFMRFLGVYTVLLTAVYTVIAYKTPWCALGFLHGWILLAGFGAACLWALAQNRIVRLALIVLLMAGTGHLAWQAWRAAYQLPADPRNPYVYAHTSPNLLKLVSLVHGVLKANPHPESRIVKVMAPGGDYWPLPWYLRDLKPEQIGYYAELPKEPYADIMLVNAKFEAALDEKTDRKYIVAGLHQLRPRNFLELYVDLELWKQYIASLPPRRDEDDE